MEEQITNNELLEMKAQLRELKQQVEIRTTFHESRLRESVAENASYFKRQMRINLRCIIILAVMFIGGFFILLDELTIDRGIIILLDFAILGYMIWEWILLRKQFNLHKLAELDLLTAQEKIESYKLYQEKKMKKKYHLPMVIIGLPLMLFLTIKTDAFSGGPGIGGTLYNIGVCLFIYILAIIISKKMSKKENKTISTLLSDIKELKEMEQSDKSESAQN